MKPSQRIEYKPHMKMVEQFPYTYFGVSYEFFCAMTFVTTFSPFFNKTTWWKKNSHFIKEPIDDETENLIKTNNEIKHQTCKRIFKGKKKKKTFANRKSMLSSRNT